MEEMDENVLSTIQLYLASEILIKILEEITTENLWLKLVSFYMTKSLSNRFYVK